MVKRVLTVASSLVLASTSLWVGVAASQETTTTTEAPATTTTTTEAPVVTTSTTTEAPETTVPGPEETVPDTTVPETTTTTIPTPEPLVLPGQHITAGTLGFDVQFADSPGANCARQIDVAPGQVNAAFDDEGKVGAVYGVTPTASGTAGVFMIGLGAMPAGVGIVSVSDGECEFDAIGVGSFVSDGAYARIVGVGAGLHPAYENADYVSKFVVEASVGASSAPAVLDLAAVEAFLLRERPGLVIPPAA